MKSNIQKWSCIVFNDVMCGVEVPAGVRGSGDRRRDLSLQRSDPVRFSSAVLRPQRGRVLGVSSGRHAAFPEGARRRTQFHHPRHHGH